ncbi:Rpn family recombination-promoting nuclease/putative transposase [Massilia sp. W12]|uniref:Rpn family recombination-promoting nuclease/putative transposase n=1 Tax=Massilia sp. W12 TaxID=3126507 RepID=UPI0030D086AD
MQEIFRLPRPCAETLGGIWRTISDTALSVKPDPQNANAANLTRHMQQASIGVSQQKRHKLHASPHKQSEVLHQLHAKIPFFAGRRIMGKYLHLWTDFGFQKVFGEESNKDLLISFLNTLLPAKHQIASLEFSRNEWQGVSMLDRKAIFDLHCKTPDGAYFLVELQKAKQNFFKDRSLYYASFPIQEQGQKGDWDYRLQAVYTIGILDFIFDEADKRDVIHTVQLKNQHNQVFYDKLTFIYLTLPNFSKTLEELQTLQDKWLFVFRHLDELDSMPDVLKEAIFTKLFQIAELNAFAPQDRAAYQASLKYYRDLKNVTDTAFDEGREEGRAEWLEQGLEQGWQKQSAAVLHMLLRQCLGAIPEDILATIDQPGLAPLEIWLQRGLHAQRLDDVFA